MVDFAYDALILKNTTNVSRGQLDLSKKTRPYKLSSSPDLIRPDESTIIPAIDSPNSKLPVATKCAKVTIGISMTKKAYLRPSN